MARFTAARTCFCELSSSSARCWFLTSSVASAAGDLACRAMTDGATTGVRWASGRAPGMDSPSSGQPRAKWWPLSYVVASSNPVDLANVTSTFALGKNHQVSQNSRLERRYDQSEICVMDAESAFHVGRAAQSLEPFPFWSAAVENLDMYSTSLLPHPDPLSTPRVSMRF